ncbi:hypothetical protein [Exiguobacterium profundum]
MNMNMKRFGLLVAVPLALLVGCGEADELKTTATDTEEVVEAEANVRQKNHRLKRRTSKKVNSVRTRST